MSLFYSFFFFFYFPCHVITLLIRAKSSMFRTNVPYSLLLSLLPLFSHPSLDALPGFPYLPPLPHLPAQVRDPVTRLLAVYLRHCAPQPSSKKGGATGTSTDNEDEEGQDEFKDGSRSLTEEETTAAAFDPQDQGQGGVENRAAAAAASWWLCHPPAQHFHSEVRTQFLPKIPLLFLS